MFGKPVRIGAVLVASLGVFAAGMGASHAADPIPKTPHSEAYTDAGFDASAELLFRPVTPCRAVDTRNAGGAFAGGGVTRIESMVTGLSAQGGNNANCGVPATAQAITASVTVVGTGGAGDLKIYPANASLPNASAMAWSSAGLVTTTGVNVTLSSGNVKITANGASTDVVVDITGYYVQQITASVAGNATFFDHSRRVLSVARKVGQPVGAYSITFDRSINNCSAVASTNVGPEVIQVHPITATVVEVNIFTLAGALHDDAFQITVNC